MFQNIISQRKNEWLHHSSNTVSDLLFYIKQKGKLRKPQIEAIEIYLFLKIAGENKPLWLLISEGFFNKNENLANIMLSEPMRNLLSTNMAARALFEMRGSFPELEKLIYQHNDEVDYVLLIQKMFYGVAYTDYLFSLPMGAGKTFLMASFIYIDLYFAQNDPENKVFAHNFIVLAPSGLKSSIIPSLRTIEQFDPTWVLPEPSATQIKRLLKFEILDQPKTSKSTGTKNPNSQKVLNLPLLDDMMGTVLVVNAEKVILDKVEPNKDPLLFEKTVDEKEKAANELRYLISKMPNLSILIDEVHHAATDDIKLRQVVSTWNTKGTVTTVLGFSGTPYLSSPEKIEILAGFNPIKLTQITNVVYYYPLKEAVKTFLKRPEKVIIYGTNIDPLNIIQAGVEAFKQNFWTTEYADGTCAKLAIYCSSIEKLEDVISPFLLTTLQIQPNDILKYHQGNKTYKIPKENHAEFVMLDTRASRKKIVLLVQIGKEGWDCRSLAGVVLSQKGDCPTNMVLQTACRCLRQIHYPEGVTEPEKTAIICLNEDNEKALRKQLNDEQDMTADDLFNIKKKIETVATRPRHDRTKHLNLPKIDFYQLKVHFEEYTIQTDPNTLEKINAAQKITHHVITQETSDFENTENKTRKYINTEKGEIAHFNYWLLQIVKEGFGSVGINDLRNYNNNLQIIFDKITFSENETLYFNERYPLNTINSAIRKAFHCQRDIAQREEIIPQVAEILILEKLLPIPISDLLVPPVNETERIVNADAQQTTVAEILLTVNASMEQTRQMMIAQGLQEMANNLPFVQPTQLEKRKDQTLHIIPYRFDSNFEKTFLQQILQDADVQDLGLEVYFNGEDTLTEFKIDCYTKTNAQKWQKIGAYYPDFLVIQRKDSKIHRLLIIETKGAIYAHAFADKRHFVETEFLKLNNDKFGYNRFDFLYLQDDDKNYLHTLNTKIKAFFNSKS